MFPEKWRHGFVVEIVSGSPVDSTLFLKKKKKKEILYISMCSSAFALDV